MGELIRLSDRAPRFQQVAAGETLSAAVERYLGVIEGTMAAGTVTTYGQRLRAAMEILGAEKPVRTIQLLDLEQLLKTYRAGGRKANTVSHLYSVMNGFLDWCNEVGLIEHSPHQHWRGPRRTKPDPRGLSVEVLIDLLRQLVTLREQDDWQEQRNETLVWFLVTVGARRIEAAMLRWSAVDLKGGVVTLHGKGDKKRKVPLLGPVRRRLERLQAMEPADGAVFAADPRTGRALRPESINAIFKRWIVDRTGVALTPHDFRHSFAQLLRAAGAELDELQDILGHENFETTRLYYGKTPLDQLREAVERHPLLDLLEELEAANEREEEGQGTEGEEDQGADDWSI